VKYLDEYRDPEAAKSLARQISSITTKPWKVMEVCGGQTHSIVKYGIDQLIPDSIELIHGPGCPVCVTPIEVVDYAIAVAGEPNAILCSFGDMLRVPGSCSDLFGARARGADVRLVYSPLDALAVARQQPDKEVVFLAVGFETTAPTVATAVLQAHNEGLKNFSVITAHVRVPPAIVALMSDPGNQVNGFLAAGHVCTVMGCSEYEPLSEQYRVPIVVTGFEPVDILHGLLLVVEMLEQGSCSVKNQYSRVAQQAGNLAAQSILKEVFVEADQNWRGLGVIPLGGLSLAPKYAGFDASNRFSVELPQRSEESLCRMGEVLRGTLKPHECGAFGHECRPENPLGAAMVSAEGACSAYYRYRKHQ
jgi:hydrogenase expression/formation protein HypD